MPYRHGVYVTEIQTRVQAAPPVDSALPFVIGSAPVVKGPVLVSSWSQFRELFGADDVDPDSRDYTLCAHAYYWFVLAGRGECIMQSVASPATAGAVVDAIASIHTVYERFGRVASLLCVPSVSEEAAVAAAMVAAVSNIGGRFKGIALCEIPAGDERSGATGADVDDAAEEKSSTSPYVIWAWPNVGVGDLRFPASVALAAALNATDGQYGGFPYVSPSNKPLPVTGAYCVVEDSAGDAVRKAVFLTRDDVNSYLGSHGITGFRNTAQGWVAWGDNTAAFPGSTDAKDYMIPIRRMFNYVGNQFQVFADARVDLPLNVRQLEGVIKSFNQFLAGLVGFGALNAASVELDSERNTTESLLSGTVYVRIRIAPPPAMVVIEGVLEYDVQGFERSLA